jgi:hypothetical protein
MDAVDRQRDEMMKRMKDCKDLAKALAKYDDEYNDGEWLKMHEFAKCVRKEHKLTVAEFVEHMLGLKPRFPHKSYICEIGMRGSPSTVSGSQGDILRTAFRSLMSAHSIKSSSILLPAYPKSFTERVRGIASEFICNKLANTYCFSLFVTHADELNCSVEISIAALVKEGDSVALSKLRWLSSFKIFVVTSILS